MNVYRARSTTIACTLTPAELEDTRRAWERLLRESLVAREDVPGGVLLEVHPESADTLRRLVDVERECCRWISFELDGPVLTMTAEGSGEQVIRETWG